MVHKRPEIIRQFMPRFVTVRLLGHFLLTLEMNVSCFFFNDREVESWFINGNSNPLAYPRMHDITDAIAIVGIRSLPKMISILADCFNLFYGQSNIALSEDHINITSPRFKQPIFKL